MIVKIATIDYLHVFSWSTCLLIIYGHCAFALTSNRMGYLYLQNKRAHTWIPVLQRRRKKIGCLDSGKIVCVLWFKKLSELYLKSIQNLFECHDNENAWFLSNGKRSKLVSTWRINHLGPQIKTNESASLFFFFFFWKSSRTLQAADEWNPIWIALVCVVMK